MTMTADSLPTPLARVLDAFSVSQTELAARTGLTRQTISDAYHGRGVSLDTWVEIAKALHVPLRVVSPESAEKLSGLVVN
jgi:transcriptional regulator with XRE-family HTH domain